MKIVALGSILLLTSLTLPAQNDRQSSANTVLQMARIANTCPIGMRAGQRMNGQTLAVRDGQGQMPFGQHIHLSLLDKNPARIVSAKVTAYGLSAKYRFVRADAMRNGPSSVTKSLDVVFSDGQDGTVSADLVLPGFTAVNSIVLESIGYADGSTRTLSPQDGCHVAPDAVMLVADR
jgi:hypothetical protein